MGYSQVAPVKAYFPGAPADRLLLLRVRYLAIHLLSQHINKIRTAKEGKRQC